MFYFLNKHTILQFIACAFLFGWAVFTILTQMTLYPPQGNAFFYKIIFDYLTQHQYMAKGLAVGMLFLELVFVYRFYAINKFSDNQTFVPVFFFLLCMHAGSFFNFLSPAHFTLFFLSWLILYNVREKNDRLLRNRVFTSGIFVGLASIVDVNALSICIFLILALFVSRYSSVKEIVIMLAGLLMVYIYVFTSFFMSDTLPALQESVRQLTFFETFRAAPSITFLQWVSAGYLIFSMLGMAIFLKWHYDSKLIVLRKRYMIIVLLSLLLIIPVFVGNMILPQGLLYLIIPISLYCSMLCGVKRRFIFHDVVMILLIVLLWL